MSYFAFRFFAVKAGIESATPISERVGFRMQSRHFLSCALVAASAWCWSSPGLAQGAAVAPTEVLARGPAGEVTVADVQAMVGVLVPVGQRGQFYDNPANIAAMAEAIYGQRALATQARAAKHDETPEARRQLALGANRVLADSWIDHLAGQKAPTDAQLDAHARTTYNANPNQFMQPEQVHARHILVAVNAGRNDAQAKARADELLAQLRGGKPFEELAREASDDKGSAQRGGDLGTFGKGHGGRVRGGGVRADQAGPAERAGEEPVWLPHHRTGRACSGAPPGVRRRARRVARGRACHAGRAHAQADLGRCDPGRAGGQRHGAQAGAAARCQGALRAARGASACVLALSAAASLMRR